MRKVICTILAPMLAVGVAAEAQVCSETRLRSDVNDSGTVTTSDALLVLKEAVGQPTTIQCPSICTPDPSAKRIVDNGDGTFTDRQSGLMWEIKTDDGSVHDKDNQYSWSAGSNSPDGSAYTQFLAALNAGGGAAGHMDWRLPTFSELVELFPLCAEGLCGPTQSSTYWSSSTNQNSPATAWYVNFYNGSTNAYSKTNRYYVRAVRAGS